MEKTTTTITIRNVDVSVKEYIDNYTISNNLKNNGQGLAAIVDVAKTAKTDAEIEAIKAENAESISKLNETIKQLTEQLQAATAENTELKNRAPEIVEKTVEKTIEVEKQLTGSQFICELPEEIAHAARKIRKFVKSDGFVDANVENEKYPQELVIVSVKQFINRHYIDHIDNKL